MDLIVPKAAELPERGHGDDIEVRDGGSRIPRQPADQLPVFLPVGAGHSGLQVHLAEENLRPNGLHGGRRQVIITDGNPACRHHRVAFPQALFQPFGDGLHAVAHRAVIDRFRPLIPDGSRHAVTVAVVDLSRRQVVPKLHQLAPGGQHRDAGPAIDQRSADVLRRE